MSEGISISLGGVVQGTRIQQGQEIGGEPQSVGGGITAGVQGELANGIVLGGDVTFTGGNQTVTENPSGLTADSAIDSPLGNQVESVVPSDVKSPFGKFTVDARVGYNLLSLIDGNNNWSLTPYVFGSIGSYTGKASEDARQYPVDDYAGTGTLSRELMVGGGVRFAGDNLATVGSTGIGFYVDGRLGTGNVQANYTPEGYNAFNQTTASTTMSASAGISLTFGQTGAVAPSTDEASQAEADTAAQALEDELNAALSGKYKDLHLDSISVIATKESTGTDPHATNGALPYASLESRGAKGWYYHIETASFDSTQVDNGDTAIGDMCDMDSFWSAEELYAALDKELAAKQAAASQAAPAPETTTP